MTPNFFLAVVLLAVLAFFLHLPAAVGLLSALGLLVLVGIAVFVITIYIGFFRKGGGL